MGKITCRLLIVAVCAVRMLLPAQLATAADLSSADVLKSIERGKRFLINQQLASGAWSAGGDRYQTGVTSLALLALLNSGLTAEDPAVRLGLKHLRSIELPNMTYEVSLMIMALAAANEGGQDKSRIYRLAQMLEEGQVSRGDNAGLWSYGVGSSMLNLGGDRSNGQFAVLGLRDASYSGYTVDRKTWERTRAHWRLAQNGDGGWGYSGLNNQGTSGSMTVAGIATLVITEAMLNDDDEVNADGTPVCCPDEEPDEALERGLRWMERHFAVGSNPGGGSWLLYYLYGMERAGRLSGRRFFGKNNDWYRSGAEYLTKVQDKRTGEWRGVGGLEQDPVVGTSFALLFLSKGLAPVLINKLKYGPRDPLNTEKVVDGDWNKHHDDIRNLTEFISGLDKWPKLLTTQMIDIKKAVEDEDGGIASLLQAPVLYISGTELYELQDGRPGKLKFTEQEIALLREYVSQGGFILAANCCHGAGFHDGIQELVSRIVPETNAKLKPLPPEHPIYFSEYPLKPDSVELWGVDFGCRTAIVYSPDELSCYWDKWTHYDPPKRPLSIKTGVLRATKIGANIIAYATGREPPAKLDPRVVTSQEGEQDDIERGLLQIAQLRHTGGWNTAPKAVRNLLLALNQTVGMAASTKQNDLPATDGTIYNYPLLYMHGRNRFQLSRPEQEQLKKYLEQGGVLFADACCGSPQFDASFRTLMGEMFANAKLERISPKHEMFTTDVGYDIRRVHRRMPNQENRDIAFNIAPQAGEPFLEGIQIGGRYAVIYSKYDISCALERQASIACSGYVEEDAVKIAVNVVLYSLLQDVDANTP